MNRNYHNNKLFFFAFLALILAVVLQFRFKAWFDYSVDLVLVALLVLAFFLPFFQVFLLAVFTAWLLNWQPALSYEITMIVILPVIVSWARRFLPGRFYFSFTIVMLFGLVSFYAPAGLGFITGNTGLILESFVLSFAFGLLINYPLSYFLGK